MIRRSITHVLLSLLLLVSQQMAVSHLITHWSDERSVASRVAGSDNRLSKAIAHDQSCAQCLAFAQIASAVGGAPRAFVGLDGGAVCGSAPLGSPDRLRTVCVFRSRAPPVLA